MELNEEHLKVAETQLKRYLPRSLMKGTYFDAAIRKRLKVNKLHFTHREENIISTFMKVCWNSPNTVYGLLMLRNRVPSDPMAFFVDEWPNFNVFICRPQCVQRVDLFKDILVFANDENILEETLKKSSVIDWSRYLCFGFSCQYTETFKAVASEKGVPGRQVAVCHMMILDDVSTLPDVDSSRITLSSLDESHISLVNQTWTLGKSDESLHMIRSMVTNFPSCCVLDAEGKPVAWILVYSICAMGMLHTLPEHREKGYAKVLICSMAKRLHAEGYPVYCLIDEDNTLSYKIFKNLGFTEDPSFRGEWFEFNEL